MSDAPNLIAVIYQPIKVESKKHQFWATIKF